MNIDLSIVININNKYSLPFNPSYGDDEKPFMLISFDDYYTSVPVVETLETNKQKFRIKLKSTIKNNVYTNRRLEELINTDIGGAMNKKYNNKNYVKNIIPSDSFIIIKIFTPTFNETDQVCDVIKCGAIVALKEIVGSVDNVTTSNNGSIKRQPLYIHNELDTEFGHAMIKINSFELLEDMRWYDSNTYKISSRNIGYNSMSTMKKHKVISQRFDRKINEFLKQFAYDRIYKSKNIRCHYNFSTFGFFVPLSFVLVNGYDSNVSYWLNIYRISLLDILLKHQIATFKDIEGADLSDIDMKYWKNLSLELKYTVLAQMFRIVPNSIPYISDFISYNERKKFSSENFNPCALFNLSSDCEDYASISKIMFNSFKQCNMNKISNEWVGLFELWLMSQLFVDSVTLYRVTTAAVREPIDKMKTGITAHMNLILIPMNTLFKNITIDKVWNSSEENKDNIEKMTMSMKKHLKKFVDVVNRLSKLSGVSEDKFTRSIPVLSIEGTGPLCPFVMYPENSKTRSYVKSVFKNMPKVLMEIYHTPKTKNVFFTHAMLGLCDMLRFGIDSDGWVYSQSYGNDASYGCKYTDLISKTKVNFILRPFLSHSEIQSAYFTSRLQPSTPSFRKLESLNSNNNYTTKLIENSKLKFSPIFHKKRNLYYNKENDQMVRKRHKKMCSELKGTVVYNNEKKYTGKKNSVVLRIRVKDFDSIFKEIKYRISMADKIVNLNFYFEDLFDRISNIVFVLEVSY